MNHRHLPTALAAAALLLGATACSSEAPTEHASDVPTEPERVVITAYVTETPTPSSDPTAVESAEDEPAKKAPAPEKFTMPNALGLDLQSAQEAVKALLGVPVWPLLQSHDVKDGWRLQLIDSQWQVCDQDPAAGETFTTETMIDFGVVKLDETCP